MSSSIPRGTFHFSLENHRHLNLEEITETKTDVKQVELSATARQCGWSFAVKDIRVASTHTYTHTYARTHARTQTHTHTHTYARTHARTHTCLLYTSDAADDGRSVDLGGRRIIKKKIF